MKIFYNELSKLSLQDFGISIPLTDKRVERVIDELSRLKIPHSSISGKSLKDDVFKTLLTEVHDRDYIERVFGTVSDIEATLIDTFELFDDDGKPNRYEPEQSKYPLADLRNRALAQAEGAILSAEAALEFGSTFFLGGGFHHAMSFGGRGFCYVNDIVMAAKHLQNLGLEKIWVIDTDVHKGDGTAELTYNDPSIKTLSIHMEKGWPLDSERLNAKGQVNPWFIPSDFDIPIAAGDEDTYLNQLEAGLHSLHHTGKPDFIFVVQGSDAFEKDQLPSSSSINLDIDQMLSRDLKVHNFIDDLDVPHCHLMAGGYGDYSHIPFIEYFKSILTD